MSMSLSALSSCFLPSMRSPSGWSRLCFAIFVLHLQMLVPIVEPARTIHRPFNNSISAIFVFGDSTVDPGNNNFIGTPFKSNFPPYGIDFADHIATGRFTDGRLITDFIAAYAGIKENVPPYLDPKLSTEELMTGVSFASAGSGFDPLTTQLTGVVSMEKQLEYFREYKMKLESAIGKERTKTLISKAAFIISAGHNDILISYYVLPFRRQTYDIPRYQDFLVQNLQQFIEALKKEGARMMTVAGLSMVGCAPAVITVTSNNAFDKRSCNDSISSAAFGYNQKLQKMLTAMDDPKFEMVYADIYGPVDKILKNPSQFGIEKLDVGCCGSGLMEITFLCNQNSPLCKNPSKYLFFDAVHLTEAGYKHIFQALRPTIDEAIKNFPYE